MKRILSLALIVALVSTFQAVLSPTGAQAADGSLVIAALRTLEREYVWEVNSVRLLNAAVASLRMTAHLSEDMLPDIPSDVTEAVATYIFLSEFRLASREGAVPETELAYAAARGMLSSLHDSHVSFLAPTELEELKKSFAGKVAYTGIGVQTEVVKVSDGTDATFITDVFPGAPGATAGLKRFDRIIQVDGKDLANVDADTELIRGPAGSTVTLTIRRGGQVLTIPVTRGPVRIRPVAPRFIRPGVAYVRVFEFSEYSGFLVRIALLFLASRGPIKAVILDLRGNPGGNGDEAMVVAGAFLPEHTILAHTISRTHSSSEETTVGPTVVPKAPLAILTDHGTASTAEEVVMALRDAHRAIIIGEKTAGEIGDARLIPLPEGGMLVTQGWVVGPRYEVIEGAGISPDLEIALTEADMEKGEDTQLDAAIRVLEVFSGDISRHLDEAIGTGCCN